jgi:hypothetical protein
MKSFENQCSMKSILPNWPELIEANSRLIFECTRTEYRIETVCSYVESFENNPVYDLSYIISSSGTKHSSNIPVRKFVLNPAGMLLITIVISSLSFWTLQYSDSSADVALFTNLPLDSVEITHLSNDLEHTKEVWFENPMNLFNIGSVQCNAWVIEYYYIQ